MSQFFKFLLLSELLFIKMPGVCPRCDKNVYFAEEVLLSFFVFFAGRVRGIFEDFEDLI